MSLEPIPPWPSPILTEAEAIRWLRLDLPDGPRNPKGTLKFYRQAKLLKAVRIGRQWRYTLPALHAFLERLAARGERQ
jgi:hypothetical protein